MDLILLFLFAPVFFIACGIAAGCVFVDGSIFRKFAFGILFGVGATIVALGGWWTLLWLVWWVNGMR